MNEIYDTLRDACLLTRCLFITCFRFHATNKLSRVRTKTIREYEGDIGGIVHEYDVTLCIWNP